MKKVNAYRWLLLITGILLVALGIWSIFTPLENLVSISIFIALSVILSGISEIVAFVQTDSEYRNGWLLAGGIFSILLGILTFAFRGIGAMAAMLPFLFAFWVISGGIMRVAGSFSMHSMQVKGWGWLLTFGILSVIMGVLLVFSPVLSAVLITIVLSGAFITFGVNNIAMFASLTSVKHKVAYLRDKINED